MLDAGAHGYVDKSIEADELYSAIRTVLSGKPYYSSGVSLHWMGSSMYPRVRDPLEKLTPHEMEVLKLVLTGLSDKEIASKLYRSPRTIEKHRHNGMLKLGVHNLAELVLTAVRLGMSI
jgi:DNA-binding NarL/FixJ family response regulator